MAHPRYTKEEIAQRGKEWYEREIRSKVEEGNKGKILLIDVETGDYEIDEDDYAAVTRLRTRRPSAEIWLGRVGQPAAYRMRRGR